MKLFRKPMMLLIVAALAGLLLLSTCETGPQPVQREAGQVYELVLLHTNDHHGAIDPTGNLGGLAERATFISQVRAANASVLLLDSGDMNTGQATSNMFKAEPDFIAYNMMGYDAATYGNHEFDNNRATLQSQIARANFPFLNANIMEGNRLLGGNQNRYKVFNYEGIRIGVFGLTTEATVSQSLASPVNLRGLTFTNEIEAARGTVDVLRNREKVDIVIALTHMGEFKYDENHITSHELAEAVDGIDIILDAHTHTLSTSVAEFSNGTRLVQAGNWGRWVGQAKLSVVDGNLVGFDWQAVEISGFEPDAAVTEMLTPYREQAAAYLEQVIGEATAEFPQNRVRLDETALGTMITDNIAWWVRNVQGLEIDFAFSNGGGIRAPLAAGPFTVGNIQTILPFDNYVQLARLTGAELQSLFEFIGTRHSAGAFPQFSSEVSFTLNVPEQAVSDILIGGQPIDPARVYTFATNDFIIAGGDGYPLNPSHMWVDTSVLVSAVVIEALNQRGGTITPEITGRVQIIGAN